MKKDQQASLGYATKAIIVIGLLRSVGVLGFGKAFYA